jgi:hypothetical protein
LLRVVRLGRMRKIEKPVTADEQVGDNAGRAAVKTFVSDSGTLQMPQLGALFAHARSPAATYVANWSP